MTDHIEAMARAMAICHGYDPDEDADTHMICDRNNGPLPWWRYYEEEATAALAALSETHLIETQAERQAAIDAAEARGHARGVAEERERGVRIANTAKRTAPFNSSHTHACDMIAAAIGGKDQ